MVSSDVADGTAFDYGDRFPAVPDVFPDQRACGLVILSNPAALGIEDGVDRHCCWRGRRADRLLHSITSDIARVFLLLSH